MKGNIWLKALIAVGGGIIIGSLTYAALILYEKRKSKALSSNDNQKNAVRRILVLGLNGAGKSSILSKFGKSEEGQEICPTDGFNIMCLQTSGKSFNIWEIGGSDKVRSYWGNFLQDTDILVFVIDASDVVRLDEAINELHKVLQDKRLQNVPVLILANKQDLPGSRTTDEISKAVNIQMNNDSGHSIRVMGTQASPGQGTHSSVKEVESWLSSYHTN